MGYSRLPGRWRNVEYALGLFDDGLTLRSTLHSRSGYPFIQNATVALGFPDIIFLPNDALTRLLARQARTNADIVLGLFRANRPQNSDMVDVSDGDRVRSIIIKPLETNLSYTWINAV